MPFRIEMRKHFFSQRVVSLWNSLPQSAVEAGSLDAFKRELDRAVEDSLESGDMGRRQERGNDWGRSAMITVNGGAGSKGRMADFLYLLSIVYCLLGLMGRGLGNRDPRWTR